MEQIKLLNSKSEYFVTSLVFLLIFTIFISIDYFQFKKIKSSNLLNLNAQVINIYKHNNYFTYKLKSDSFTFFTSTTVDEKIEKLDFINLTVITSDLNFWDYLKGTYLKSFNLYKLDKNSFKKDVSKFIKSQHKNENISQIYEAIFLAIPTNKELKEIFAIYSISHLIAISGFHLGVLSFCIYFILFYPYKYFQTRYFPYRNRRFNLMLISLVTLFLYLLFTDLVPSLLRAFVMMLIGIFILRSNIKLISFESLFFTFLVVISIFPSYLFSISFWFSIIGVFYIFLYMKYFLNLNKILTILFFNLWIFLVFNPIVHFFFGVTTLVQFLSIPLTLLFTIFYPLELLLHLFNLGNLLDGLLEIGLNFKFHTYEILTPLWLLVVYILVSLFSIIRKEGFWVLNILMIGFNLYLYY